MSKKYMHVPVFTCPKCKGNSVTTIEWHQVTNTFWDFPEGLETIRAYENTGETDILVSARCRTCDHELTDDELALVAKSIAGLALSKHPTIPIVNPKGYVIVNPAHHTDMAVMVGYDEAIMQREYTHVLRDMFYIAKDCDNEFLYIGMVIPVTSFQDIKDRFALCEECGEVYEPETEQCCEEE